MAIERPFNGNVSIRSDSLTSYKVELEVSTTGVESATVTSNVASPTLSRMSMVASCPTLNTNFPS